MDNHHIPFHAPVSVAVTLHALEMAARDGIITEAQAHELWTLWVGGPELLTESTVPMPLAGQSGPLGDRRTNRLPKWLGYAINKVAGWRQAWRR